jgi:RNA polymerase sigma factor (sigma-70 family)
LRVAFERWDWHELGAIAQREARRILANRQDAEDAAQEAVIRAYKARTGCQTPNAPNAWMRAIAKREAYRLYARRPAYELTSDWADGRVDDATEAVHNRLAARHALAGTTNEERSLLVRRYVLEQTSSQISAELSLPASTVRVRVHRASKRIRERAGQPLDD